MRKFYLLSTLITGMFLQTMKAQDVAGFNFTIGANNLVSFTNTTVLSGTGDRKAHWFFGDGTHQAAPVLANVQHQYLNGGVYNVCLKIFKYTNATGTDSVVTSDICKTVTLQNIQPDSCAGHFSDSFATTSPLVKLFVANPWHSNGKRPEQICWIFGDGKDTCISYNPALSNNYAVYHTYAQPGQYNVCIKIKYQGGCQSGYCRTVQVGAPGTGDECKADYNIEPVTASPLSRHFIALPWHHLQKKPVRICWEFGDGKDTCVQYSTAADGPYAVNHTYANYGSYNVCIKILYDGGCEAHKCKVITIAAPPVDSCVVRIGELNTNNPLEKRFYATTMTNRPAEKICWSFGDGKDTCINLPTVLTSTSVSIGHLFPAPGVYRVCAKVLYAGGCVAQHCIEIVIRSNTNLCGGFMTDSLAGLKKVLFKGFSVMNPNDQVVSWRWTFGDGSSGTGQQVAHEYAQGGNYEVCLYIKTRLGCETRICKQVAVRGINSVAQLQLSPNPVTSVLHAVFQSLLQEQVTISIYNANGIVVRTAVKNAVVGINSWDIEVGTLPTGVYSVIVSSPHQLANALFFKQ